jgi:hypothetical protein
MLKSFLEESAVNVIMDTIFAPGDEETIVQKIHDLKGTVAAVRLTTPPERRNAAEGSTSDRDLGALLRQYYNQGLVITTDRGETKTHPMMSAQWADDVLGKMKRPIAEYLADFYGKDPDTMLTSLIVPKELAEVRGTQGVIDRDLPYAFGFRNAEGTEEQYRVYPKNDTYEIQKYDEKTKEWAPAPGRSGDSRSLTDARNKEWSRNIYDYKESQRSLEAQIKDFEETKVQYDEDDISFAAQDQRRTEERLNAQKENKRRLLQTITIATEFAVIKQNIEAGRRENYLTRIEAEALIQRAINDRRLTKEEAEKIRI